MNDVHPAHFPGRPDRMTEALGEFLEAAESAAVQWGQADFTVRQGLDITWMTGNIIRDLRIAGDSLSGFQVTGLPAGPPGSEGDGAGRGPQFALNGLWGLDDRITPGTEISKAAQCLGQAHDQALVIQASITSDRRANPARGGLPGGDPVRDGPAVAAAHAMHNALGVASGIWQRPAGSAGDRDTVVTQMMLAVNKFEEAALILSLGGPAKARVSLRRVARDLDLCTFYLRESLVCSLTHGYQPGTGNVARDVAAAYPLISEGREAPPPGTGGPRSEAPGLAATAFPRPPGTAERAGQAPRPHGRASGPGQARRPGASRRNS